ncbi:MAG: NUDIX hydrolase [Planctomycetaceae bacterium]|nr:NUDIX hydrolase [Planctomycetaceae bacterium]
MPDDAAVTDATTVHTGKFIVTKLLTWRDANGVSRQWEAAVRRRDFGAVLVIPRLIRSDRYINIRQFRPPADCYVYEFPAGLVDAGETPDQAAARELREETGYAATSLRLFPRAYTTPGLSNENVTMVLADIDEDAPENRHPTTEFDPSENIETVLVPRADLVAFYTRESDAGQAFDAKLAAYILALGMQ